MRTGWKAIQATRLSVGRASGYGAGAALRLAAATITGVGNGPVALGRQLGLAHAQLALAAGVRA